MAKKQAIIQPQPEVPAPLESEMIGALPSETRNSRWTVETGLYALIVALALFVRLYRLGLAPLSESEAQLALAAWRGALPPEGASPLLTWLNAILFAVFESGDGIARLVPALVGSALVVLPMFLRERIGKVGALFAALMLAVSPVVLTASRIASGDALVAAVLLGLIVAGESYLRDGRVGWLYAGAALLGIGLASGRTIYSALIVLVVAVGFVAALETNLAREKWQAVRSTPGLIGRLLITLAAVFVTSATALAWNTSGLGSATNLLSAWIADFREGVTAWQWPFQVLAVYEPLIVVTGIGGLVIALQRKNQFGTLLIVWLVVAVLLVALRAGRSNGDTLLVVLPLALLSGYAFDALAGSFRSVRLSAGEVVLIVIVLVALAYALFNLTDYLANPSKFQVGPVDPQASPGDQLRARLGPAAPFILILAAMTLIVFLTAWFAAWLGSEAALRGATLAILIALGLATWSAGWGAAQLRPGDPREIITGNQATSLDVRDLTRDVIKLSADRASGTLTLPLTIQSAPDGVLGWYLRALQNAKFVSAVDASLNPQAVLSTNQSPALAGSYAGQKYTLQHAWHIEAKPVADILKWLLYRQAERPTPTLEAVLWVKQGQ